MAPTEFHLFPKLPAEIRRQIWLHTLSPRTLRLWFWDYVRADRKHRIPALLQTCYESRKLAKEWYTQVVVPISPQKQHRDENAIYVGYVYFSPLLDKWEMPHNDFLEYLEKGEVGSFFESLRRKFKVEIHGRLPINRRLS